MNKVAQLNCFWEFDAFIGGVVLPARFTFPFYYEPHPLALLASNQLKKHLLCNPFPVGFGLENTSRNEVGKMFGVLVVQKGNKIGFLCAFSGKIGSHSNYPKFVPPVFDVHLKSGFYKKGESQLNAMNDEIDALTSDSEYLRIKKKLEELSHAKITDLERLKREYRLAKEARALKRKSITDNTEWEVLNQQSAQQSIYLKKIKQQYKQEQTILQNQLAKFEDKISQLKKERKLFSGHLQKQIFEQYNFLNANKEKRSLGEIFSNTVLKVPPAGAGECAAPKLLHYAYANDYTPLCMAEFWWGKPPESEVRIHENFYPACKGKCEPILGFMLEGLKLDKNPLLTANHSLEINIIYEDEAFIILEKPHELLSVPGNTLADSVVMQLKNKFPTLHELQLVHRLDMSTSGVMIAAKNKRSFKYIQRQFIQKSIQKRYVARLSGILEQEEGIIDLPLKSDFLNRPMQSVCFESGKQAITHYKKIATINGETLVYFYPKTGRTHQLRIHAAHEKGLCLPIKGDDIYGNKSSRLFLHAESISFNHPNTKKQVDFGVAVPNDFML